MDTETSYTAFGGSRIVAKGKLEAMLLGTKTWLDGGGAERLLIFEDQSGRQVDFDFRGTAAEVLERALPKKGPGRPRLGVVSAEVSLLPRHWDWLESQSKNVSATLRSLVDEARKRELGSGSPRSAIEAADRFMWSIAGDLGGCEEASRAIYAGDRARLAALVEAWPGDLASHVLSLLDGGQPG